MKENLIELEGTVDRIIFKNNDNFYTIFLLETDANNITCVGTLPYLKQGERIKINGTFKIHPNFGEQIQVNSFEKLIPSNAQAIYNYLASSVIKGIGKVTAKKLVEKFGEDTLEIIAKEPNKLCKIKGITESKAEKISKEYKNIVGMQAIVIELTKYNLSVSESSKIYKEWGENSLELLKVNPYSLCAEPFNFNFEKVEIIAKKLNIEDNFKQRIIAGVIYILKHNQKNGHVCLPLLKLQKVACDFLNISEENIGKTISEMLSSNLIKLKKINNQEFIYTVASFENEEYIATRISLMLKYPAPPIVNIEKEIKNIESAEKINYDEIQKQAITKALEKGMLILTGGPGTGKTTTLNAIIKLLKNNKERVYLCAPTGRAAQRMNQITGEKAKTIHRLLDASWDNNSKTIFGKNESNLLKCDALIVDEISMVDEFLFASILKALPLGCRLILVGDKNQLPCIGPGNIIADLAKTSIVPIVELNKIFRQSSQSLIVTNAHKVINGEKPCIDSKDKDFFFINSNDEKYIQKTIVELCSKRLSNTYGFNTFDIQVLSPSRKGPLGTFNLNLLLQQEINLKDETKQEVKINNTVFRENDKVMQIKNDYEIIYENNNKEEGYGIFNGDIGKILKINKESEMISVKFEDKIAYYTFEQANNLDLAYAITVHKSQGCEFEAVIIPASKIPKPLKYRNLLYTAITRARKIIVIIGEEKILNEMIENNKKMNRYTGLDEMIREKFI